MSPMGKELGHYSAGRKAAPCTLLMDLFLEVKPIHSETLQCKEVTRSLFQPLCLTLFYSNDLSSLFLQVNVDSINGIKRRQHHTAAADYESQTEGHAQH